MAENATKATTEKTAAAAEAEKPTPAAQAGEDIAKRLGTAGATAYNNADDAQKSQAVGKLSKALKPSKWGKRLQSDWFKLPATAVGTLVAANLLFGNDNIPQQSPPEDTGPKVTLAPPFHAATTAMVQTHPTSGNQIFTAPLEYFHRMSDREIPALFEKMSTLAPELPIAAAPFTAFDADNRWGINGQGLYPQVLVLADVEDPELQSDEARAAIVEGIHQIETDVKNFEGLKITYRFTVEAGQAAANGQPATPDQLVILRDINSDKKGDHGEHDMAEVFAADIP